jgi:hypothetical protein
VPVVATDTAVAAPSSAAVSHVAPSVEAAVMPLYVVDGGGLVCSRQLSSRQRQLCSPTAAVVAPSSLSSRVWLSVEVAAAAAALWVIDDGCRNRGSQLSSRRQRQLCSPTTAVVAPSFAISHVWLSVEAAAAAALCMTDDGGRDRGSRLSSRRRQLCSLTLPLRRRHLPSRMCGCRWRWLSCQSA